MSEQNPTGAEYLAEYGVPLGAYLAMETALAKRVLEDRIRSNAYANTPNNWPAGQSWEELGQTSHETLWRAARKEAGLPEDSAFKNDVLMRERGVARGAPDAKRVRDLTLLRNAISESLVRHDRDVRGYLNALVQLENELLAGSVGGGARALQEPSEAAIRAADEAHDKVVARFLDGGPDVPADTAMREALHAAYKVDFGASGVALQEAAELLRRLVYNDHGPDGLQGTLAQAKELLAARGADRGPEPSGPWRVDWYEDRARWYVHDRSGVTEHGPFSEAEARAVCQALNRVASAAPAPDKETT